MDDLTNDDLFLDAVEAAALDVACNDRELTLAANNGVIWVRLSEPEWRGPQ